MTTQERAILSAIVPLLERRYDLLTLDHYPDEVPQGPQAGKSPDAFYVRTDGPAVRVEVSELSRKKPLQYSRKKAERAEAAGDFSIKMYPVYNDADTVRSALLAQLAEANQKFLYREDAHGDLPADDAGRPSGMFHAWSLVGPPL